MKAQDFKVIIVGAGVSGLTCGICLLEHGFAVTIVAREVSPNTTSDAAAAYWFPNGIKPEEKVRVWARSSYQMFQELAQIPGSGVSFRRFRRLFEHLVPDPPWADLVHDFEHADCTSYPEIYRDGYQMTIPLIDTPIYMPFLKQRFLERGGEIREGSVTSLSDLAAHYRLIINCSGVGAKKLANDPQVYPIRGQVVLVRKPPGLSPDILSVGDPNHSEATYIVPRSQDCLLGGTKQKGNSNLVPDMATAEAIIARCAAFNPQLRNPDVIEHKVGLRPGRPEVRLELENLSPQAAVIHNYGHGGNGHTLAWGCAADVTELALRFRDS